MVLKWKKEKVEFFKKIEKNPDISYDMWKTTFISASRTIYFPPQNYYRRELRLRRLST